MQPKNINELNTVERSELLDYMANSIGARISGKMEQQAFQFMQRAFKQFTDEDVRKGFDLCCSGVTKVEVIAQINAKTIGAVLSAYSRHKLGRQQHVAYKAPEVSQAVKDAIIQSAIVSHFEKFKNESKFMYPESQMKMHAFNYFDFLNLHGHTLDHSKHLEESKKICREDVKAIRDNATDNDRMEAKRALIQFDNNGSDKVTTVAKWLAFKEYFTDLVTFDKDLEL